MRLTEQYLFYIWCPYLFFHRPHQRDHQWTNGFRPPWTSPASCWPLLPATQWEPWQALTELPAIISTPAGGERNSPPGELSSCSVVHVFRDRVVLACLVSVRSLLHFLERLLAEVHTQVNFPYPQWAIFYQRFSVLVFIKSQHREVISKIWERSWVFFSPVMWVFSQQSLQMYITSMPNKTTILWIGGGWSGD